MARPNHVLECAFGSDPDAALTAQVWTDISAYLDVKAGVAITRGRTDEFSTIQPGGMSLTLKNVDGRFTMANPASPYAPNVVPGKKIRYGLMWPGGGVNLSEFPTTSATDGAGWFVSGSGTPTTVITNSVVPQVGTHALQITWGSTPANQFVFQTLRGLVVGKTYTASAWIRIPSAGSGPHCTVTILGVASSSATTVLDAWQRRTVTFVATANTHQLRIVPVSTPPVGSVARVNAVQVEDGSAATTNVVTPGTFAWRFTGDVNEWPLDWQGGNAAYAETQLTASDRLAKLGDLGEFQSMIVEAGLHLDPVAFYPLTEETAATSAADVSENAQPPLTLVQVGSGGNVFFGEDTYTVAGSDFASAPLFYRGKATGAWFNPASAGNGKFLRAGLNAPTTGPGATIALFANAGGGSPAGTLASMQAADGSYFSIELDSSVNINGVFFDASTQTKTTVLIGPGLTDDMAQQVAKLTNLGTGSWQLDTYRGGVFENSTSFAVSRAMPAWTTVSVGGRAKDPGPAILGYVAFYDYPVNSVDLDVQSAAGAFGQTDVSEGTTDRLINLKAFAGLDAMTIRGTSAPKNAGPGEIAGAPLDAIQKVVDTEGGLFLIRADGFPEFHLSNYRYNVAASMTIAADKVDPSAVRFRGDNFGVFNDVTATGGTGLVGRAVNTASRAAYGRRKGSLDTLGEDVPSLYSSAARLAYGFGTARNRITGVRVSLLNQPALIAAALNLEIGEKITITGFPSQAPAASEDLFVEGYSETVSEDDWSLTLNTSQADPWNVWQLGVAGHSELGSTTVLAY
jgi:hypothetical protein